MSWSSSTTPISSGETNATSSTSSRTAIGQISRSMHSFCGRRPADLLVDHAGFQGVADRRQKQVLGVNVGDLLLGNVAGPDQGHFGQDVGLGLVQQILDLFELLGLEPVTPRQQFQDQRRSVGVSEDVAHR